MLPITNFHSITPKPKMLQQQRMMRSLHGLPTLRLVGPPKSKPIKSRAFASEPNGPPRPRVTKEMVFHELREVSKLVFGVRSFVSAVLSALLMEQSLYRAELSSLDSSDPADMSSRQ